MLSGYLVLNSLFTDRKKDIFKIRIINMMSLCALIKSLSTRAGNPRGLADR